MYKTCFFAFLYTFEPMVCTILNPVLSAQTMMKCYYNVILTIILIHES